MSPCHVAIAGVTGAVGAEFLAILAQRQFPADSYKLLASSRSAGRKINFLGTEYTVEELSDHSFEDIDIALFSAGASISKKFAPAAAKTGTVIVDNSSAFRMDDHVPLVIPEINPQAIETHKGIIANPNCSTIIGIVPVWPLHQANPVRRMVVSTYQAVSGAGAQAMEELKEQTRTVLDGGQPEPKAFQHPCAFNVFSHDSDIEAPTATTSKKTRLAQRDPQDIRATTTSPSPAPASAYPVLRTHCESINLEFDRAHGSRPKSVRRAAAQRRSRRGTILDDCEEQPFPHAHRNHRTRTPSWSAASAKTNPCPTAAASIIWVSGDQLRKGAALNAVQIAECLLLN